VDALLLARGAATAALRRSQAEWFGGIAYRSLLGIGAPQGLAAHPHSPRPADPERGKELLQGVFQFGGSTMRLGANGDPFDRPSPSRAFALGLHRSDWLPDLLSLGEQGVRPGVRLYMDWRRLFGRWNAFSWSGEVLERRVLNLACAARPLTTHTSEAEAAFLTGDLARQARHLLAVSDDPSRAVERAVAAGVAGCVLAGQPGEALIKRSLKRLTRQLPKAVLGDGGHATRSPQRGLELLLDLLTLDDALLQRGVPAPEEMSRAIDRLGVAVRFFTLADGRLAAMQGGEPVDGPLIAAALAHEEARKAPLMLSVTGYHKLHGPGIEVIADTGAPAAGVWSTSACAQPLSLEVVCSKDRLITSGSGRLTADGSGAELGEASCGAPLTGIAARGLGERLVGGPAKVTARRHETDAAMWLEASHDGWLKSLGLTHDRRLFLDRATGELRGEDRFEPPKPKDDAARLYIPFAVRFHLGPEVKASLAQDGKTVILRGPGGEGRWLRTDAAQVAIEPSPGRSGVIVLRGQVLAHKGGRVRWKLSASET
jgi:uncharacterized heparinase superfamily protein